MTYDNTRHLELLKRFLYFKNQDKDLYIENQLEYIELQNYRCALYHHIFWEKRKNFILLMENYIHNLIGEEQFEIAFSQLWWERMKVYDTFEVDLKGLKNFELDATSDKFGSLVTAVFRQFEVLEDEEWTDREFKAYVQKILQEIRFYV